MAYATTNPPQCLVPSLGAKPALWTYGATESTTAMVAAGYFTNGLALGMKYGDLVFLQDTSTGPNRPTQVARVSATPVSTATSVLVGTSTA